MAAIEFLSILPTSNTSSARGSKSIIDYIIVNRRLKNLVQDMKIVRGSDIGSDNFLVTSRINLLSRYYLRNNTVSE